MGEVTDLKMQNANLKAGDTNNRLKLFLADEEGSQIICYLWDKFGEEAHSRIKQHKEKKKEFPFAIRLCFGIIKDSQDEISVSSWFNASRIQFREDDKVISQFGDRIEKLFPKVTERLILSNDPPKSEEDIFLHQYHKLPINQLL
ncbi:unnamed protein product, partial [Cuscuta europaea]